MNSKLAIEGGPKAVTNTLASWPQFDEKAIQCRRRGSALRQSQLLDRAQGYGV